MKLALNSQLLTFQILKNDVQVLILCLSYFITTVNQTRLKITGYILPWRYVPIISQIS